MEKEIVGPSGKILRNKGIMHDVYKQWNQVLTIDYIFI